MSKIKKAKNSKKIKNCEKFYFMQIPAYHVYKPHQRFPPYHFPIFKVKVYSKKASDLIIL